jgi:hypothetical protein
VVFFLLGGRIFADDFTLREDTVVLVHQSAKNFLLREALIELLPKGIGAEHHIIFSQSLIVMFKALRRDVFDTKLPEFSINDVRQPSPSTGSGGVRVCVLDGHLQDSTRINPMT